MRHAAIGSFSTAHARTTSSLRLAVPRGIEGQIPHAFPSRNQGLSVCVSRSSRSGTPRLFVSSPYSFIHAPADPGHQVAVSAGLIALKMSRYVNLHHRAVFAAVPVAGLPGKGLHLAGIPCAIECGAQRIAAK